MRRAISKGLGCRSGASAVEYSMLVGIMSLGCIMIWRVLGSNLSAMFYGRLIEVFTQASNSV